MNLETNEKVDVLLAWIADNAVKGGEFVKEQAPDVARQIVAWGFWEGTLIAAGGLALLGVTLALAVVCYRHCKKHDFGLDCNPGIVIPSVAIMLLTTIGMFITIPQGICQAVKASVAPKVYLLEQLKVLK